jgi:alpha-galactosidase
MNSEMMAAWGYRVVAGLVNSAAQQAKQTAAGDRNRPGNSLGGVYLAVFLLCAIPLAAVERAGQAGYRAADIHQQPLPGIRMTSGLAVCDEALWRGRWITRYRLSTGMIEPEIHLESVQEQREALPIDAFELAIEGQDLAGSWRWVKAEKSEVHNPDGLLVTLELASNARPISVRVHTLLFGGPVMVRWLEVTNTGNKPTAITAVSPWSGLIWDTGNYQERLPKGGGAPFEVGYAQYEEWGHEGAWHFEPVINQSKTVSGTRGKSGWGHPTFFAHNTATGEWFVASLGWSGNWTFEVSGREKPETDRATLLFRLGPSTVDPVLRVLSPGETVETPRTHVLCKRGDLDSVIQAMHEHVRREVLPSPVPHRDMLVEANHRGYIVDHESEEGLKREIDLAADAGAEMFVIDAGWYGPEPNRWWANAGDWYAGAWLPHDLTPVREYARRRGLLFGLWVEIESVGSASKLRQEHPDWVLTRNGKPVAGGRQLDVSNPAVAAWMESEIARVIKKYDLDLFRIDYNTTVEEGGNRVRDGFVENTLWRHVDALYKMFDRLRGQFPNVVFQNCAGGGGRLDLGMLHRFQNTELSDWMRAPRGLKILNGMTWILPPEILLRTFGTEVGDVSSDADLVTQLRAATMALPIFRGLSPSREEFNPLEREEILRQVGLYKDVIRPKLKGCRVFHHTPLTPMLEGSPWLVLEYTSPDAQHDLGWLFRTSESGDSTFRFTPRGLDLSKTYDVTFANSGLTMEIPGSRLLQEGIPVRLEGNLTSELLIFRAK